MVGRTVWATWITKSTLNHQVLDLLLGHWSLKVIEVVAGVHDPPPTWLVNAENWEAIILVAQLELHPLLGYLSTS